MCGVSGEIQNMLLNAQNSFLVAAVYITASYRTHQQTKKALTLK